MEIKTVFSSFIGFEFIEVTEAHVKKCESLLTDAEQAYTKLDEPEFADLYEQVSALFKQVAREQLGIREKYSVSVDEAWINRNGAANIVEPHYHNCQTLSACLYIKAESGDSYLNILSPVPMVAEKLPATIEKDIVEFFTDFNSTIIRINAQTGLLVVFPSWLMHYVQVLKNSDRISMAFNGKTQVAK